MSNRRRLARERLEIYLVHLLMAYRHLIFIGGLLLLVFGIAVLFTCPQAGISILLPALVMLLVGSTYQVLVFTARIGAWIATIGES